MFPSSPRISAHVMCTHGNAFFCHGLSTMRRSETWTLRSSMYSLIPHVVRHRRPVALPAGLHGLMPVYQRTLPRAYCTCLHASTYGR